MRASPRRFLKTVLVAGIVLFVVGNMHILLSSMTVNDHTLQAPGTAPLNQDTNYSVLHISPVAIETVVRLPEVHVETYANQTFLGVTVNYNLTELQALMARVNLEQVVLNGDRSAVRPSVVLVVQVHNRVEYLRLLIRSLRAVRNIENTLVIFSHDIYSDELNAAVKTIDFCPVLQIFYPYSMQIFPDKFPGADPRDCPRDMKKDEARRVKCLNADHPDKYGHYREAKYAQTKNHWFWKLNHIFDKVHVLSGFTGLVVLLEEDHYLTPDFLHMLNLAKNLRDRECRECGIITMGSYDKNPTYFGAVASQVYIDYWLSSKHNMGMALDRAFWEDIKRCAEKFCAFDDYNWDWSMQFIGMTCLPSRMKVLASKSPRVYHMGECGLHFKGRNCNPVQKLATIEKLLTSSKGQLFPASVSVGMFGRTAPRMPKPNGGWGDIRDQQLCMSFVNR